MHVINDLGLHATGFLVYSINKERACPTKHEN